MVAGGAYIPPAPWLNAIREKIDDQGEKLVKILNNKELRSVFGEIEGEKLKSAPRGFPKDHPYIEYLKLKSFLISKLFTDKEVTNKEWFGMVLEACRIMKPLNDF